MDTLTAVIEKEVAVRLAGDQLARELAEEVARELAKEVAKEVARELAEEEVANEARLQSMRCRMDSIQRLRGGQALRLRCVALDDL